MALLMSSENEPSLYQMLVAGVCDAVYLHDIEGRILEANPAATDQTGYSREELLQMHIHDLSPYRDGQAFKEIVDTHYFFHDFFCAASCRRLIPQKGDRSIFRKIGK